MKLAASQFLQKVLKENRIFLDIILNLCKSAFAAQDRGGIPSPSWRILIRAGRVEKSSLKARQQLNVNVGEGSYEDLDYRRRNRGGTPHQRLCGRRWMWSNSLPQVGGR
jgi:hypothetical protein